MAIPLPEFIAQVGDEAASELFGVKVRTVQSWRRRERLPRPDQANAMVQASSGQLSLESIYAPAPDESAANAADDPDVGRIVPLEEIS